MRRRLRRDRAFSIFLSHQSRRCFSLPSSAARSARNSGWHYGFAAAGVGMTIGLVIYLFAAPTLPLDAFTRAEPAARLTRTEWQSIAAILALMLPVSLFWATYEQQGNTIALWADQFTTAVFSRRDPRDLVPGLQPIHDSSPSRPSSWRCGAGRAKASRRPSPRWRSAVSSPPPPIWWMVAAAWSAGAGQASCFGCSAISSSSTVGELYISPVGLSLVTKSSALRLLSMMMGLWLRPASSPDFPRYLGTFWSSMGKPEFFLMLAIISGIAATSRSRC